MMQISTVCPTYPTWGMDIIFRVPGLETAHLGGTLRVALVKQLKYQTPKNLFNPTVKYCPIGPCLQSRCHQRRSLSPSRRGTQSQKRSVTRNCHQKQVWTQNKSTIRLKTMEFVTIASQSLDMLQGGDKSGKVISCGHRNRNPHQTIPSLLYIWSGVRRFQSRYTEYRGIPQNDWPINAS